VGEQREKWRFDNTLYSLEGDLDCREATEFQHPRGSPGRKVPPAGSSDVTAFVCWHYRRQRNIRIDVGVETPLIQRDTSLEAAMATVRGL
jgi:hypothetical protein